MSVCGSDLFSGAQDRRSALIVLQRAQDGPVAWFRVDILPIFNSVLCCAS